MPVFIICDFVIFIIGVFILNVPLFSTAAAVARFAVFSKACMNSGRQSG